MPVFKQLTKSSFNIITRSKYAPSYVKLRVDLDTASTAHALAKEDSAAKPRWQLCAAACVQRVPVISADLTDKQLHLLKYLQDRQEERSVKSDHELRLIEDTRLDKLRKSDDYEESEIDSNRVSAWELERDWESQTKDIKLAPRTTEHDKTNNMLSADRELQRHLTLLVKQRVGDAAVWTFPQALWTHGESLKQTAERALSSQCGLDARFLGHAPCSHYLINYSPELQKQHSVQGAKVFVFKAHVFARDVAVHVSADVTDYKWLTKHSLLSDNLVQPDVGLATQKFLFEL